MQEVKQKISILTYTLYISIILLIILSYKTKIKKPLKNGAILTLIILATLSILNFDFIFTKFHELFITTQWLYPPESKIIQMFPQQFFINITKHIAVLASTIAASIILAT